MAKWFRSESTWPQILRFPIMMGCIIGGAAYMTLNFQTLFRKELDSKRESERNSYNQLFDNSMNNKGK